MSSYEEALHRKPNCDDLRNKYADARAKAIEDAIANGRLCLERLDFDCALSDADYALNLDNRNLEATDLHSETRRVAVDNYIQEASTAAKASAFESAFHALARMEHFRPIQDQAAFAQQAQEEVAQHAVFEAEDLRKRAADERDLSLYLSAIDLLEKASAYSQSAQTLLTEIKREHQELLDEQYEKYALRGDEARASGDYSEAVHWYEAAEHLKPGRSGASLDYCRAVLDGKRLLAARDFSAATQAFETAVQTGEDHNGTAAKTLSRTQPKPYVFQLQSLLIAGSRPDGEPWVGEHDPAFARAIGRLTGTIAASVSHPVPGLGLLSSGEAADAGGDVAEALATVPTENIPTLIVEITLPDGRVFELDEQQGLYVEYQASFELISNYYDSRTIRVQSFHRDREDRRVAVGSAQIQLGSLHENPVVEGLESLLGIRFHIERGSGVDGQIRGMRLVQRSENRAQQASLAGPQTIGWRIDRIELQLQPADYQRLLGGRPSPFVEIRQGGRTVFKSESVSRGFEASWAPTSTYLFLTDDEQIQVVIRHDGTFGESDILIFRLQGSRLQRDTLKLQSQNGTRLRMSLSRRAIGPR